MSWNSIEVKVGLIIIASFSIFVFLLFQSANWPWISRGDVIPIYFDSISELKVGAMVQISGVQVGKVTGIQLLGDKVEVKTRIRNAYNILRKGCKVNIEMVGLVGETYVNIINTSDSYPLLTSDDMPLIGSSLTGVMGIMERVDKALEKISASASILEDVDKNDVETIVSSLKDLVNQTEDLTGQALSNLNNLIVGLDPVVAEYQNKLEKTISGLNNVVVQAQTNIAQISKSLDEFSQGLNKLLDDNSGQIEEIVANFRQISENLNTESERLFEDLVTLKSEISELVTSTQTIVDKDAEKIDQLIDNLNRSAQNFNDLSFKLDKVLDKVEKGEGTVAKLLNEPEPLENLNTTLNSADKAIKEFTQLSNKISRKTDRIKIPSLQWDYELRYSNLSESLRNEIALTLGGWKDQRYRIGFSSIGEEIDYEFQYERAFGNFVARAGFIRSKPGLGLDYWLLSKRLGFSLEGIAITEKEPWFDLETRLGFIPNCFIIIGAQDLTGDIGYSGGIQIRY